MKTGLLLVISGASGTGKDSVINEVLKHPVITKLKLKRLVTCADRCPRKDETHGVDYYFVTPQEMDKMHKNGELVENPQLYGISRKATPKNEFLKILKGDNLLWRIESYLASKVALGTFFDEQFGPKEAEIFKEVTKVVCITSPKEQIEGRRKSRDREKYDPKEYLIRDVHDHANMKVLLRRAVLVENLDGKLNQTVEEVVRVVIEHHGKNKKRV
jgi:guanylate kinase